MSELTPQQTLFIEAYLANNFSVPAAAQAAKITPATGRRWVTQPAIKRGIEARLTRSPDGRQRTVDAAAVLEQLASMLAFDPARFLRVEGGELVVDWSRASADDIRNVQSYRARDGVVTEVKLPDRAKLLELIGRHIDVQAWQERQVIEVQNAEALVERLQAGRRRARGE